MTINKNKAVSARQIFWLILFSIAMGYLESAVVVYLRDIYYPNGFNFPLVPIRPRDLMTELGREAATLIMLLSVGILTGRTRLQKVSFFLMAFAVWDIFYYVFLKLILGWPASLMTPDILFLLPIPWVGPVFCACLLSLTMIVLAVVILYKEKKVPNFKVGVGYWCWFIVGSLIVILSFLVGPLRHLSGFSANTMSPYQPKNFDWWLFIVGEIELALGLLKLGRTKKM